MLQHVAKQGNAIKTRSDQIERKLKASGSISIVKSIGSEPAELELLLHTARYQRSPEIKERIGKLLASDVDWDSLIKYAAQHGVVGLAYRNLAEFSDLVPPATLNHLKQYAQVIGYHNLHSTTELIRLLTVLESNEIVALPFKGPMAAIFIYGDLSLRQFCDLDILIPKKDIRKVKELLLSVGYYPKTQRSKGQEEAFFNSSQPYNDKFTSADGKVAVEVHWAFTSRHNSFLIDYDRLRSNLDSVTVAGKQVLSLRPEDLLVILCQHGSKHFWPRLLWICDIAFLVQRHPNLDWRQIAEYSTNLGARRMVFLGLHLAHNLLGMPLPDEFKSADRVVKRLSKRVEAQYFSGLDTPIQGFEAHLFSCSMRERNSDKLRYTGYHFFAYIRKSAFNMLRQISGGTRLLKRNR